MVVYSEGSDGGACLAVAAGGGARIASMVGSSLCRRPKAVHGVDSMLLVAGWRHTATAVVTDGNWCTA